MSKGAFFIGLALGVVAGVAGKIAYDNRELVIEVALDSARTAKEGITNLAQYASEKVEDITSEISRKASEFADQTDEQFEELEESIEKLGLEE